MRFPRLINKLIRPINFLKYRGISGISSRKEFRTIIDRERERASRNNHQVSLVVFDLGSFPDNGTESKQLIKNIIKEKRKIDEIGWYKKHNVGVIMPYTPSQGARKFSVRLSRTLNFIMPDSFCYLFTYPLEDKADAENCEDNVDNVNENFPVVIENIATEHIEKESDDFVENKSARGASQ